MVKISPSLMCMDLAEFKTQIKALNNYVDQYHVDIMDGHYVKNMTLSPMFIEAVRKQSDIPIDAHLMVTNPEDYIDPLIECGTRVISIHAEHLVGQAFRLEQKIHDQGLKFGVVLNPETPVSILNDYIHRIDLITIMTVDPGFTGQKFIPESLEKSRVLSALKQKNNYKYDIQIDGSCNKKNYKLMLEAGADILIVGTSGLFNLDNDINQSIKILDNDLKVVLQHCHRRL